MTDTLSHSTANPELTRIIYDGKLEQIWRIWLINLALFFVTFSLYRFWGRTRIRQYIWAHTSILGSRLEYTGTGGELLKGFCLILPLYVGISVLNSLLPNLNGGFFILFTLLGLVAIYSGVRYRITRTLWRGIRGDMSKDGYNAYQTMGMKRLFMDTVSLGITIPRSQLMKWQVLVESITIGGKKAQYFFDSKGLALSNFLTLLCGAIAAVPSFFFALELFTTMFVALIPESDSVKTVAAVPSILLAFLIYYSIRQYYVSDLVKRKFSGILISNVRFYTYYTRKQFIEFKVLNMLILIVTFGLGSAFILHRKARFFGTYMATSGAFDEVDLSHMVQSQGVVAEGLLDSFGLDIGIFS